MKTFDQTLLMFVATFLLFVILPNMVWTQTTQANLTCYFPFNYNGKNYTTCTTSGYGFLWCSPTPIFSGQIINCTANISQPCLNDGTRISTSMGIFTCQCSPLYTGIYCQTLINPCMSNPCQLNGICQETLTGFECICLPEYQDTFCQTHVNPCLSNPCVTSNTISCEISDKSMKNFICMCHPDYVGIRCETPCVKDTICLNRTLEYKPVTTTDIDRTIPPKLFSNLNTMIIISSTVSGGTLVIAIICIFFCYRHQNKKFNSSISPQSYALQTSGVQQQPTYAQALYNRDLSTVRSMSSTPSNISYAHAYEEIGSVKISV